ncbi:MAG: MarR family transcriptional regulator [Pseudomonadota bacterium]
MTRKIETWRTQNAGRVMFAAADQFVRDSLLPAHQNGYEMMTVVLLALMQNLDLEGTRLTTIAQRARMTKASMMELVNKAQALDLVERRPDPDDKRAKIVSFTAQGLQLIELMHKGVALAERRLVAATSRHFVTAMKQQLRAYAAGGERPASTVADVLSTSKTTAWRVQNPGRVLLSATDRFVSGVLRPVHGSGFDVVTPVLLTLFRNLDRDGTRLTELAARARMTKQAMAELVEKAEAAGFVEKQPDPDDQRAKLIAFTVTGHEVLDRARDGVMQAEQELASVVGTDFLTELKEQLLAYVTASGATAKEQPRLMSTAQSQRLAS